MQLSWRSVKLRSLHGQLVMHTFQTTGVNIKTSNYVPVSPRAIKRGFTFFYKLRVYEIIRGVIADVPLISDNTAELRPQRYMLPPLFHGRPFKMRGNRFPCLCLEAVSVKTPTLGDGVIRRQSIRCLNSKAVKCCCILTGDSWGSPWLFAPAWYDNHYYIFD